MSEHHPIVQTMEAPYDPFQGLDDDNNSLFGNSDTQFPSFEVDNRVDEATFFEGNRPEEMQPAATACAPSVHSNNKVSTTPNDTQHDHSTSDLAGQAQNLNDQNNVSTTPAVCVQQSITQVRPQPQDVVSEGTVSLTPAILGQQPITQDQTQSQDVASEGTVSSTPIVNTQSPLTQSSASTAPVINVQYPPISDPTTQPHPGSAMEVEPSTQPGFSVVPPLVQQHRIIQLLSQSNNIAGQPHQQQERPRLFTNDEVKRILQGFQNKIESNMLNNVKTKLEEQRTLIANMQQRHEGLVHEKNQLQQTCKTLVKNNQDLNFKYDLTTKDNETFSSLAKSEINRANKATQQSDKWKLMAEWTYAKCSFYYNELQKHGLSTQLPAQLIAPPKVVYDQVVQQPGGPQQIPPQRNLPPIMQQPQQAFNTVLQQSHFQGQVSRYQQGVHMGHQIQQGANMSPQNQQACMVPPNQQGGFMACQNQQGSNMVPQNQQGVLMMHQTQQAFNVPPNPQGGPMVAQATSNQVHAKNVSNGWVSETVSPEAQPFVNLSEVQVETNIQQLEGGESSGQKRNAERPSPPNNTVDTPIAIDDDDEDIAVPDAPTAEATTDDSSPSSANNDSSEKTSRRTSTTTLGNDEAAPAAPINTPDTSPEVPVVALPFKKIRAGAREWLQSNDPGRNALAYGPGTTPAIKRKREAELLEEAKRVKYGVLRSVGEPLTAEEKAKIEDGTKKDIKVRDERIRREQEEMRVRGELLEKAARGLEERKAADKKRKVEERKAEKKVKRGEGRAALKQKMRDGKKRAADEAARLAEEEKARKAEAEKEIDEFTAYLES